MTPQRVADYVHGLIPDHHGHMGDAHGANLIVRAYRTRWRRSTKRCPPGFQVNIPRNSGDIEANAHGWVWDAGRKRFEFDSVSDGLGPNRRAEAREGAWDIYEETWQSDHDALLSAGAIKLEDRKP